MILASFLIALEVSQYWMERFGEVGEIIGASVSAIFLILISIINFLIFLKSYKRFKSHHSQTLLMILQSKGL